MYLNRWDFLKFYGLLIVVCAALTLSYIAIQSGALPTSSGNDATLAGGHSEHSRFALKVAANGETVYTVAENVSEAVRQEIEHVVFPSPEAAIAATSEPLPGNPAYAHAVNLCYHGDGKVSNNTGYGRHLTWFRYHENNRHYTATAHQVLSNYVWVTTDVYRWDVARSYCGC